MIGKMILTRDVKRGRRLVREPWGDRDPKQFAHRQERRVNRERVQTLGADYEPVVKRRTAWDVA